jgi:hypothetical protein
MGRKVVVISPRSPLPFRYIVSVSKKTNRDGRMCPRMMMGMAYSCNAVAGCNAWYVESEVGQT